MSDQNDTKSQVDQGSSIDAPLDRFAYLNEQSKKAQAEAEAVRQAYRNVTEGKALDADKAAEAIKASAEEDRRVPKLDPMELIRQVERMRKDGFDEATIRAAFDEVMAEQTGNFRRPLRRIVRSEGMVKMLTQDEMNRHYTKQVYPPREEESDSAMDERINLILERIEQTKHMKLEIQKTTLKMRVYRVAYFLLRRPLQFAISVLTKIRKARNKELPNQNQQLIKDLENLVKTLEK